MIHQERGTTGLRTTTGRGMEKIRKTDEQWRAQLTPEQFHVTRRQGTERPFCGAFWDNHEDGIYHCVCCDLPLFGAATKFDSGTGWPSFTRPVDPTHVENHRDLSHGMVRTEVTCARCDAHLGHVFPDGPPPSGLRYCLNSLSLRFEPKGSAGHG